MTTIGCDSCGRPTAADALSEVRRAYFFDAHDPDPDVSDVVERWCESCCQSYPHVRPDP